MILLAASTFFQHGTHVEELSQAQALLTPLLGNNAATSSPSLCCWQVFPVR
jgi:manganese transport protein